MPPSFKSKSLASAHNFCVGFDLKALHSWKETQARLRKPQVWGVSIFGYAGLSLIFLPFLLFWHSSSELRDSDGEVLTVPPSLSLLAEGTSRSFHSLPNPASHIFDKKKPSPRSGVKDQEDYIHKVILSYRQPSDVNRRIAEEIVRSCRAADINPLLITAIIASESGFEPYAKSPVGALGLMQLMPDTARHVMQKADELGIKSTSRLFDIELNILLGIAYLQELNEKYDGNLAEVIAAYNWGPGNVDRASRGEIHVPHSVVDYVKKVSQLSLSLKRNYQRRLGVSRT